MNKPLTKTQIAILSGRSLYTSKVVSPIGETVLKVSGNEKLGKRISKGKWSGFPIFTLTLEERATCPTTCEHWANCYGNNMFRAKRYSSGPDLMSSVWRDLEALQKKYPGGFAVRLHVLGDFFSVDYVGMWRTALDTFPALHVWGYTARRDCGQDPVADALASMFKGMEARWQVRLSGWSGRMGALSADAPAADSAIATRSAFICPEQTGRTKECGTCGACWSTDKAVVFLTH